jgi:photosystem II stability/assembly factor-like uncharacterized protein
MSAKLMNRTIPATNAMKTRFFSLGLVALLTIAACVVPSTGLRAQQRGIDIVLDSTLLAGYHWRNLGPDRGGRSIATTGVIGRPDEGYFGAVGGGLWKTTDSGENWFPVTDFQISSASVGAVAVSESDPDLIFIGTGETCIRGNILPGDGVYRSRDAGETWEHVGFTNSHGISKIRIHPTNPDIIFVASFGKYSAPSEERGVFKSTDGGDTWRRVLYRNDETGAIDVSIDRNNPDVMYAALWEAYRKEYQMSSGGPGSGMFKSTDGGETWEEMTRNPGMPQEGLVGRIGITVSGANSNRVWALFENDNGGLFRSDDAGATWALVNDDRAIRQRAFYYTHVFADPVDEDVVYMQNTSFFRSSDGGETYETINNGTHGDFHDMWIDPDDPTHLMVANDGGGAVSVNTGDKWTDQEFSTSQFYHVVTTAHEPFHVCGSQQDNSTLCLPGNWNAARMGFGQQNRFGGGGGGSITEGSMGVAYRAGGGEPGYIAPDPKDVDVFFSGTNNGSYIDKFNRRLNTSREVNPYPWFYSGEPGIDVRERWQWTFPIIFSPIDENRMYASSQRLWMTLDGGRTWEQLSDDLTRADPATLQKSGGPITGDMNGPEMYATIFSVGPGKLDVNVIWTGSDDGLVHVTRDNGATWTNVTPPDMPDFGRVSQIDASSFDSGRAYVSVRLPLLDDFSPYIWKTDDYGETWTKIVNGIAEGAFVHVVREDPNRDGLLYAGTNRGVYISYNDGALWQPLNPGLPDLPIIDLIVEKNELVIGSHGRGFWILDNIAPLREMMPDMTASGSRLFTPPVATRSAGGVTLSWWLTEEADDARLEIIDASGNVLRTYLPDASSVRSSVDAEAEPEAGASAGSEPDAEPEPRARRDPAARYRGPSLSNEAGLNYLHWDLRTQPAEVFPGMIMWGVRTFSPAVPPGEYSVRLTAGGDTQSVPLTVQGNPWLTDVTDADMVAQFEFGQQVRDKVTEANRAVIAIRNMKAQLDDRLERSDDRRLRDAAGRLDEAASDVEGVIYQVKNQANQDPLNYPIRVNNRLANLMSMSERGDGRPGNNMPVIFDILVEELAGYTDRLEVIWSEELAAVNAILGGLDLPTIDPDCGNPGGCMVS